MSFPLGFRRRWFPAGFRLALCGGLVAGGLLGLVLMALGVPLAAGPGEELLLALPLAAAAVAGGVGLRRCLPRAGVGTLPPRERVVVLGGGRRAGAVLGAVQQGLAGEAEVTHVLHPGEEPAVEAPPGAVCRPGFACLARLVPADVDRIVVALDDRRGRLPLAELVRLRAGGVRVEEATAFLERVHGKIEVEHLRPSDLLYGDGFVRTRWRLAVKRALDVLFSLGLLVLCAPLFVLVPLAIWLESGRPVFFVQERSGRGGRPFRMIKFRSMVPDAEPDGRPRWASRDDPRVTRVGAFLRRTRLDELPQLINVLRGEMSFVGPRPERPCFAEQFRRTIPWYGLRESVRPGLTGWAQVQHGYADDSDTVEKLKYDLYYVKHLGPLFDLRIVLRTVGVVLTGYGAR